jgi:hypothetical protein
MKFREFKIRIITLFLLLNLFIGNFHSVYAYDNNLVEFSLYTVNQNTRFNYTSYDYETKYQQLGVNWYESFSSYFHAGIEIGYIDVTQLENPLTSAQFTSGEYAGLLLRFLPIDNNLISFIMSLNYRYNQTTGKSTNQESQFTWSEALLSNELQFQMTEIFGAFIAAEYQILEGRQRDIGNISQIRNFDNSNQQGYRLGINILPSRHDLIRLEWQTGFKNGLQMYFTRKI